MAQKTTNSDSQTIAVSQYLRDDIWDTINETENFKRCLFRMADICRHKSDLVAKLLVAIIFVGGIITIVQIYWLPCIPAWIGPVIDILSAIGVVLKDYSSLLARPQSDIFELEELGNSFSVWGNDLEWLWRICQEQRWTKELEQQFKKLKEEKANKTAQINRLIQDMSEDEFENIRNEVNEYMTGKFNKASIVVSNE